MLEFRPGNKQKKDIAYFSSILLDSLRQSRQSVIVQTLQNLSIDDFELNLTKFHTGTASSKPLHLNAFSEVVAILGNDSRLQGKVFELLEEQN